MLWKRSPACQWVLPLPDAVWVQLTWRQLIHDAYSDALFYVFSSSPCFRCDFGGGGIQVWEVKLLFSTLKVAADLEVGELRQ